MQKKVQCGGENAIKYSSNSLGKEKRQLRGGDCNREESKDAMMHLCGKTLECNPPHPTHDLTNTRRAPPSIPPHPDPKKTKFWRKKDINADSDKQCLPPSLQISLAPSSVSDFRPRVKQPEAIYISLPTSVSRKLRCGGEQQRTAQLPSYHSTNPAAEADIYCQSNARPAISFPV